jgi:hypothetical protein
VTIKSCIIVGSKGVVHSNGAEAKHYNFESFRLLIKQLDLNDR